MPRPLRCILPNSCYHLITRSNEGNDVFHERADYEKYMLLLNKYKNKFGLKLFAWCLMNNHTHLVAQSSEISKAMHGINMSYAQYFRWKNKSRGHLWQGRFQSLEIQNDRYMINCLTYIEYNPVRAKMVTRPEDYHWSSYKTRVLGGKNDMLDPVTLW